MTMTQEEFEERRARELAKLMTWEQRRQYTEDRLDWEENHLPDSRRTARNVVIFCATQILLALAVLTGLLIWGCT